MTRMSVSRSARAPAAWARSSSARRLPADGTMRRRLKDSPAAQRARLKTGSLKGVIAVAGYVPDANNQPCIVVAILNDAHVANGALRRSELTAHLEEVRMASELISGSLHKAAELISSFKQIAVDQTNDQRRAFDLLSAVQDTIATYMPRLRRVPCEVVLQIPDAMVLDSYPGGLYQILNNLINNALSHAFEHSKGGTITVRAEAVDEDIIELMFSDDGCGMSDDVLKRVFDPFFTTKLGQGGSGLGLNISYNIITSIMHGQITVKSTLGVGTTFSLDLPLSA